MKSMNKRVTRVKRTSVFPQICAPRRGGWGFTGVTTTLGPTLRLRTTIPFRPLLRLGKTLRFRGWKSVWDVHLHSRFAFFGGKKQEFHQFCNPGIARHWQLRVSKPTVQRHHLQQRYWGCELAASAKPHVTR